MGAADPCKRSLRRRPSSSAAGRRNGSRSFAADKDSRSTTGWTAIVNELSALKGAEAGGPLRSGRESCSRQQSSARCFAASPCGTARRRPGSLLSSSSTSSSVLLVKRARGDHDRGFCWHRQECRYPVMSSSLGAKGCHCRLPSSGRNRMERPWYAAVSLGSTSASRSGRVALAGSPNRSSGVPR